MSALVRCSRCARRHRGQADWNVTVSRGIVVGHLCSACQSPEENAEAAINEATLEYSTNALGRLVARGRSSS